MLAAVVIGFVILAMIGGGGALLYFQFRFMKDASRQMQAERASSPRKGSPTDSGM